MTIIRDVKNGDVEISESTIITAVTRGTLHVTIHLIPDFIHITSEVVFVKVYAEYERERNHRYKERAMSP